MSSHPEKDDAERSEPPTRSGLATSNCSVFDRWPPADVARCTNDKCAVKESCIRWITRNQDHARVFFHGPLETYGCKLFINDGTYPVPGWQWVKCDDCGTTWKETSRDILSPSHVDCPNNCDHGGDTHVWKTERADLPRDESGNLLKYEREILTKGLGHNSN